MGGGCGPMALGSKPAPEMHITTEYWAKPIPDRSMDWSAIDSDTYDCDCDQDGFFSLGPIGYGATEEAAIADLLEKIEDA